MFHVIAVVIKMKFELIEATDLQNNQQEIALRNVLLVIPQIDNQSFHLLANLLVVANLLVPINLFICYQIIAILQLNHQNSINDIKHAELLLNLLPSTRSKILIRITR